MLPGNKSSQTSPPVNPRQEGRRELRHCLMSLSDAVQGRNLLLHSLLQSPHVSELEINPQTFGFIWLFKRSQKIFVCMLKSHLLLVP